MSAAWPLLADPVTIEGFVEPMVWGRNRYTVIRMPAQLDDLARDLGTRRVAGQLDRIDVNLALTRAPVIPDTFVWAGAGLLRRMKLEAGDPVSGTLAPVDPDFVPVPDDVTEALARVGLSEAWANLTASTQRQRLAPVESAATPATRARRIVALIDGL